MHLIFRGTRGGITARSVLHQQHSSLLVRYKTTSILIDYGSDWYVSKFPVYVRALFITHAHPDHAGGLSEKVSCPVYATYESWRHIPSHIVAHQQLIEPEVPIRIGDIDITAYTVEHSLRAPAVGYKIKAGLRTIFYVPDVVAIPNHRTILSGVDLYIGDGALITRMILVRHKDHALVGHAPVEEQVQWCVDAGISHMIVTHCGTEITTGEPSAIVENILELEKKYGVTITLAYDGYTTIV